MARPRKTGIDYFPVDVGIGADKKTYMLEAQVGEIGFARLIKLLAEIYSEGYAIKWDHTEALTYAGWKRIPVEEVNALVDAALKSGWFDRDVYETYGYLTSAAIQRRYVNACGERTSIPLRSDLYLLTEEDLSDIRESVMKKIILIGDEENGSFPTENQGLPDEPEKETTVSIAEVIGEMPQSKAKQSTEKNSTAKQSTAPPGNAAAAVVDKFLEEVIRNGTFEGKVAQFDSDNLLSARHMLRDFGLDQTFPKFLAIKIRGDTAIANKAAFYRTAFLAPQKYKHFVEEWRERRSRASPGTSDKAQPPAKCPECGDPLVQGSPDRYGCKPCGVFFEFVDGEWRREAHEEAS